MKGEKKFTIKLYLLIQNANVIYMIISLLLIALISVYLLSVLK